MYLESEGFKYAFGFKNIYGGIDDYEGFIDMSAYL